MNFSKITNFQNSIVFFTTCTLATLLAFSACQKQKIYATKTENILALFHPNQKQFEAFPVFVSRDISFHLHHYKNNGRYKLVHSYNREKYDNLKMLINDKEIKFPEKSNVIYDEAAGFLKECSGENNLITFKLNGKEELHYNFHFPAEIDMKLSTGSAVIPNETVVTWIPDEESTAGIEVIYIDGNLNKHATNYETIPNIGTYTIPEKLFKNIPDRAKIRIHLTQGSYLIDEENSVKLIAFSLDYHSWLMYIE